MKPKLIFAVQTVEYKHISFTVWDIGGQTKIRPLWQHYYENCDAIIYVVDSSDSLRMKEAREELEEVLGDDRVRDSSLLVFANKQDMPGAMNPTEITEKLGLTEKRTREWFIQSACATKGDGLYEGLDWLSKTLAKRPR